MVLWNPCNQSNMKCVEANLWPIDTHITTALLWQVSVHWINKLHQQGNMWQSFCLSSAVWLPPCQELGLCVIPRDTCVHKTVCFTPELFQSADAIWLAMSLKSVAWGYVSKEPKTTVKQDMLQLITMTGLWPTIPSIHQPPIIQPLV